MSEQARPSLSEHAPDWLRAVEDEIAFKYRDGRKKQSPLAKTLKDGSVARISLNSGQLSDQQKCTIYFRRHHNSFCFYCGIDMGEKKSLFKTSDHVIPVSQGGASLAHNTVPCCLPCNQAKGSQSLEQFRMTMVAYSEPDVQFFGEYIWRCYKWWLERNEGRKRLA